MSDITVGETRQLRRDWADRLADIDADIALMAAKRGSTQPAQAIERIADAIAEVIGEPRRSAATGKHTPAASFLQGEAIVLEFETEAEYVSVQLHYRHVNQAERWQTSLMQLDNRSWRTAIPAEYTQSPYPLQYYFEVKRSPASASLYPGLGENLASQPYFVVRRG